MLWRNFCGFVALFVLANAQSRDRLHRWDYRDSGWKSPSDNLIDIDVENDRTGDQAWQDAEEMSGSGSGMEVTDDEDLLSSGSGSGDGIVPDYPPLPTTRPPPATTTTTSKPAPVTRLPPPTTTTVRRLTPCQQLREASQHLSGNYVPSCDAAGDYDIQQCHGPPQKGSCWCADLRGREIPGTALKTDIPDCVGGSNLPRCVFQLVWQMRKTVMVTFRPQCTANGDFEALQCKGNICYCVDPTFGDKVSGTEVFLPDRPVCDATPVSGHKDKEDKPEHKITVFPSTAFPPKEPTSPRVEEEVQTKVNVNVEGKPDKDSREDDDDEEDDDSKEDSNNTGSNGDEPVKKPSSSQASMMTQPGILAATIGGSVVLLLCAVLLAMFIIYRMKKKDEGSYPLDEPKKMPNYSYQRAPEKEFYA